MSAVRKEGRLRGKAMRVSAAVSTLLVVLLIGQIALSQQTPPTGEQPGLFVDPGPQVPAGPIAGDPTTDAPPVVRASGRDAQPPGSDMPAGDQPEGDQPEGDQPEGDQPEGDEEPMPGERRGQQPPNGDSENWLLDFPEADTPWQSDGTTFTSATCTWSEVVPILTGVSLIAGPIECSDGILPTFGIGIISDGEMSAVAIRFLLFFPILTPFEGEQVMEGPPDQDPQQPPGDMDEGGMEDGDMDGRDGEENESRRQCEDETTGGEMPTENGRETPAAGRSR